MEYLIHFDDGSEGYLSHHGIKGMKWGVWNDETKVKYGFGTHSSVTNAKLNSIPNKVTDIGRQRVKGLLEDYQEEQRFVQKMYDSNVQKIKEDRQKYYDEITDIEKDDFFNRSFAVSTNKMLDNELEADNAVLSFNMGDKVPKIQGDHSFDDDMKVANPLKGVTGYQDNCACCSAASILRQKGFDVVADVRGSDGTLVSDQEKWFMGGKFKNILNEGGGTERVKVRSEYLDSIGGEQSVSDWGKADRGVFKSWMVHDEPEGSYGFLGGQYDSKYGSGGHSITYKIENGDVVCRDGQTGERYDSFYDATKYFDLRKVSYMRVDNKEPDWNYLASQQVVKYRNDYYD